MNTKGTILVVDDNLESQKILEHLLTQDGYEVRTAESGEQSLASITVNPPQLILLGSRTLDMDACEVLRRLKDQESTRSIPVILICAFSEVEQCAKGLTLGAVDLVSIPFQSAELLTRVNTQVELSTLRMNFKQRSLELTLANSRLAQEIAKRQAATLTLRKSEARYRSYFNLPLNGIAIRSLDSAWIEVNDRMCSMLGYTRDELLQQTWQSLTHPDDRAADQQQFNRILAGESEQYQLDKRYIRKDGTVIWCSLSVGCVREPDGRVAYLTSTLVDITESKLAEFKARERTKELQAFYKLSEVIERAGITLDELCQEMADFLPESWQHPENTYATIVIGDKEFRTENYVQGSYQQSADIKVRQVIAGRIEIGCLEKKRCEDEGPFLEEEKLLLDSIAERMGRVIERMQVEAALQDSESKYRELVEHLAEGIVITDPEDVFTFANPAVERIFGVGSGKLVGARFDTFLSPDNRELVLGKNQERAQGREDTYELEIVRHNHERRSLLVMATPHFGADGAFIGTMGIFRDITENKRAENEIRSLARFVSENPDAVLRVARDGTLIYVNPQALIQLPEWHLQVGQQVPPSVYQVVQGCLESASNLALDLEHREQIFSFLAVAVADVGYVNLYGHDVTRRRQIEKALKESEERHRTILQTAMDGYLLVDLQGKLLDVNAAYCRMSGYSEQELLAMSVSELEVDEVETAVTSHLHKIMIQGEDRFESRHRRKDGSTYYVETSAKYRPFEGERIVAFLRDLTERKRAEKALRESEEREVQIKLSEHERRLEIEKQAAFALNIKAEELARSNKELELFAYVASHDLQEPLRMVASYLQLFAEKYQGKLDEKADKYIHYAVDGAARMQRLIGDLLAYSRVTTRAKPFVEVSCGDVVSEVIQDLSRAIEDNQAEIIVGALPTVLADRTQLKQIFQNLIANAIKFHGEVNPRVEITVQRKNANWEFCVADNGIGIDPQFYERVFIIFQRLHDRDEYKGNGIGLSIVKKIVERHGGHIWIESKVGVGSRFLFTIPIGSSNLVTSENAGC